MDSDVEFGADDAAILADMSALSEEAWRGRDGQALSGPVSQLVEPAAPVVGGGVPSVSMDEAKAALDVAGPSVLAWREATEAEIAGQWRELREFVEWVCEVYAFETSEHHPCWWRHPWVTQEWLSLWHLHRLSWASDDSGAGPNTFHNWLLSARGRMAAAWGKTTCTQRDHVEARKPMTVYTIVDDQQWREMTGVDGPYLPVRQWPSWREAETEGEVE